MATEKTYCDKLKEITNELDKLASVNHPNYMHHIKDLIRQLKWEITPNIVEKEQKLNEVIHTIFEEKIIDPHKIDEESEKFVENMTYIIKETVKDYQSLNGKPFDKEKEIERSKSFLKMKNEKLMNEKCNKFEW